MKKTATQSAKLKVKRKAVAQLKPQQLKAVTGGGSSLRCIGQCRGPSGSGGGG